MQYSDHKNAENDSLMIMRETNCADTMT